MKKKTQKSRTVLSTWIVSYLGVALLLTVVILCVSSLYSSVLKKEIESYNNVVFKAISENISQKIYDIDEVKTDITGAKRCAFLSRIDSIDKCYDNPRVFELVSYMKEMSLKQINIFVYVPGADFVVSEHGVLEPKSFYNIYRFKQYGDYEKWYAGITAADDFDENEFSCIKDKTEFKAIGKQFWEDGIFYSITVDKNNFLSEISLDDFDERYKIAIYNDTGKMIFSTTDEKDLFPAKLSGAELYEYDEYYVDKATIKFPDSYKTSLIITENNVVKEKMHGITMKVLYTVLIGLLLCMLVIWKVLRHNYKLVKKLKTILDIDSGKEFEEIEKRILSIKEENISARNYLNKRMSEQKRSILDALIHLSNTPEEMKNEILKKEYFCVICFKLADMDEFFKEEKDILQKQFHFNLIIENIFAELFGEINIDVYSSYRDNEVVCLLNFDKKTDNLRQKIDEILSYGGGIIDTEFKISLIYAVSDICRRTDSINSAYNETKEIVDGMIMIGMKPQPAQEPEASSEDMFWLSAEKQQKLVSCLQAGNGENAMSIVNEMLDTVVARRYSKRYIKVMLYDIVCVILKSNIFDERAADFNEKCISMLLSLDENCTIERMKPKLEEIVGILCAARSSKYAAADTVDKQQKRVLDMIMYIKKNYNSKLINVSAVAYEFNLSQNYASRLFKEYVHKGMLDYINELRIEKADELLADGSYTATEISDMVGFNYVKTFYRVYKKIKGTTPRGTKD